jgi:hypothetical protein
MAHVECPGEGVPSTGMCDLVCSAVRLALI